MTKAQVAEHFAVDLRTIERWQSKRELPFVRVGGVNRYLLSELRSWAARQTAT